MIKIRCIHDRLYSPHINDSFIPNMGNKHVYNDSMDLSGKKIIRLIESDGLFLAYCKKLLWHYKRMMG